MALDPSKQCFRVLNFHFFSHPKLKNLPARILGTRSSFLAMHEFIWTLSCQYSTYLAFQKSTMTTREHFGDGAVIAAARTLPTWSDRDVPPVPCLERRAVKELQEECKQMLAEFPSASKQDQNTLDSGRKASRALEAAIKYRLHRKLFLEKIVQALDIYQERILF